MELAAQARLCHEYIKRGLIYSTPPVERVFVTSFAVVAVDARRMYRASADAGWGTLHRKGFIDTEPAPGTRDGMLRGIAS